MTYSGIEISHLSGLDVQ